MDGRRIGVAVLALRRGELTERLHLLTLETKLVSAQPPVLAALLGRCLLNDVTLGTT